MKKIMRSLGLAMAVVLIPASAYAVNLSSNDGNGTQTVTSHGDQSFTSTGKLRSNTGKKVYYRGIVIYNNYTDYTCDRISSNTTSKSYVTRGGSCSQLAPIPPSADAAGWKVCRDRTGLPDGCGSMGKQNF
ncbi:hypothetical protein [Nocardioides gilvus]|uniref:hypothetical protein n=1 Tax=Nocardioides gilvus TaxID=1735589 RepID=UPI0013A5624D|nr:hypothetical protein [Nocardioides gilvus]